MKRLLHLALSSALWLCWTTVSAQPPSVTNWHLVKGKTGIEVYTAPVPSSGRKYIKVNAGLEGTLEGVQNLFRAIDRQAAWVYQTRRAYLVAQTDAGHLVYYNHTHLPWPASDRDVVIGMRLEADPARRSLVITQEAVRSALPPVKGIVRVTHLKGYWQFRETSKGKLQVVYYLDVDPGGSLPAWIVNLFIAKGPYETFVKLRELVKGP